MLECLFSRDHRLPLNRKEAFYSATVLPGIICADGLSRFFNLLGMVNIQVDMHPDTTNIQIFSEYDLLDAIRGDQGASDAWKALRSGLTGDTPDFVILVNLSTPLLLVLEAKLFDRSTVGIAEQIGRQRANMLLLKQVLPEYETVHVALVPESAATAVRATVEDQADFTTVTWEGIAEAYENVPEAAYWVRLLKFALSRERELRSRAAGGRTHEDSRKTAAEILDAYGRPDCVMRSVGVLGTNWQLLKEDILRYGGGKRKWAVSHAAALPSRTYLGIDEFVKIVRAWLQAPIPSNAQSWEPKDSP